METVSNGQNLVTWSVDKTNRSLRRGKNHDLTLNDFRQAVESGDLPTRPGANNARLIARSDLRKWLDTWEREA